MDNMHNHVVPREHWLEPWETQTIIKFFNEHPDVGYRRLTYMMVDQDVVAVSPSTTYNLLRNAGLFNRRKVKVTSKSKGFVQPEYAHRHWHIDIAYISIEGTFYYLCSILDGYSRSIVHFEIWEQMKERDVEMILQRAREAFLKATPQIIPDNGPQFMAL